MNASGSSSQGRRGRKSPAESGAEPIVATTGGQVRGLTAPGGYVFRGLPDAAPPVGDLRWRPPASRPTGRACVTPPSSDREAAAAEPDPDRSGERGLPVSQRVHADPGKPWRRRPAGARMDPRRPLHARRRRGL